MNETEVHAEACKLYDMALEDYGRVPVGERDVSTILRALELVHVTCPREPMPLPPIPPEVARLLRKITGDDEPWREGEGGEGPAT